MADIDILFLYNQTSITNHSQIPSKVNNVFTSLKDYITEQPSSSTATDGLGITLSKTIGVTSLGFTVNANTETPSITTNPSIKDIIDYCLTHTDNYKIVCIYDPSLTEFASGKTGFAQSASTLFKTGDASSNLEKAYNGTLTNNKSILFLFNFGEDNIGTLNLTNLEYETYPYQHLVKDFIFVASNKQVNGHYLEFKGIEFNRTNYNSSDSNDTPTTLCAYAVLFAASMSISGRENWTFNMHRQALRQCADKYLSSIFPTGWTTSFGYGKLTHEKPTLANPNVKENKIQEFLTLSLSDLDFFSNSQHLKNISAFRQSSESISVFRPQNIGFLRYIFSWESVLDFSQYKVEISKFEDFRNVFKDADTTLKYSVIEFGLNELFSENSLNEDSEITVYYKVIGENTEKGLFSVSKTKKLIVRIRDNFTVRCNLVAPTNAVTIPAEDNVAVAIDFQDYVINFNQDDLNGISAIINDVKYDVYVSEQPSFQTNVESFTNINLPLNSDNQLITRNDSGQLQKGKLYYVKVKVKYTIQNNNSSTNISYSNIFRFVTKLDVPSIQPINNSNDIVYRVNLPVLVEVGYTGASASENASATTADFEWYLNDNQPNIITAVYTLTNNNRIASSSFDFTINNLPGTFSVKARSRNIHVISNWTNTVSRNIREEDFELNVYNSTDPIASNLNSANNRVEIFQGEEVDIKVDIVRIDGGNTKITVNNSIFDSNSSSYYPRGKNLPKDTSGSDITMRIESATLDKSDYNFQITGETALGSVVRTKSVYVKVKDIADLVPSLNRLLWLRAEDLLYKNWTHNTNVDEWDLYQRSNFDYQSNYDLKPRKFAQTSDNNRPKYIHPEHPSNPFYNITTPYGTKSYPCVHLDSGNVHMFLLNNLGNSTHFIAGEEVSIYIVFGFSSSPANRLLICDSTSAGIPLGSSIIQLAGVGAFVAGVGYPSYSFNFLRNPGETFNYCVNSARYKYAPPGTPPVYPVVRMQRNTITYASTFDGNPDTASHTYSTNPTNNWQINRLGGIPNGLNRETAVYYLCELIIFGHYLDAEKNSKVLRYLRAKYNIDSRSHQI